MIFTLIEIGFIVCSTGYLAYWRACERRRQALAWDRLVAQLQPHWFNTELGEPFHWDVNPDITREEMLKSIQGAQGLWAMHENARMMLEMANYAARHNASVDRELIAALRRDAMQIRVCVLVALSKYACSRVNESTYVNVAHATAIYNTMVGRMADLLQASGGTLVPTLVGAR
jgi:hypothetical protein